jgi:hypothetical protein
MRTVDLVRTQTKTAVLYCRTQVPALRNGKKKKSFVRDRTCDPCSHDPGIRSLLKVYPGTKFLYQVLHHRVQSI